MSKYCERCGCGAPDTHLTVQDCMEALMYERDALKASLNSARRIIELSEQVGEV